MMKNKIKKIIIVVIAVAAIFVVFKLLKNINKLSNNNSVFISGNIEATEVNTSFQVPGRIKEILVDEGAVVKKDEILAMLDKEELKKVNNQAEFTLKEAELNHERLKEDYVRAENLYQAGAISKQKRDIAKTSADMAEARVENLKANLNITGLKLGYAELVSPIDGVVIVKSAEAGEVIQAGMPVITLADLKNVWLTGYISETDLGKVKINQEVNIKTDTYSDKTYNGRISFISNEAEFTPKFIQTKEERVKLVYRIKISIPNQDMELKPGMPADANIIIE